MSGKEKVLIGWQRHHDLMMGRCELTQEEIDYGWHFCWEFDGLLIGPDCPEWEVCSCSKKARKE